MPSVTQTCTRLIAWLARRAGAHVPPRRGRLTVLAATVPAAAGLGEAAEPDKAGRLLPAPEQTLEPEVGRSLFAHWALWVAVLLIVALLAAGYLRRRWKVRAARSAAMALSRDGSRK